MAISDYPRAKTRLGPSIGEIAKFLKKTCPLRELAAPLRYNHNGAAEIHEW